MSLKKLLRRLAGGAPARAGTADGADAGALAGLRDEMTALSRATRNLQRDLDLLRRQVAESEVLAEAESNATRTMGALAASLDLVSVTHHVRAAVAAAVVDGAPVPHAVVEGLLPAAAFAAARDAIPAPQFFPHDDTARAALALPPRLSSAHVIATWMFLNDVAADLLGPALRLRLAPHRVDDAELPGLKLSGSRIVWVPPGASIVDEAHTPAWMTVVASLGPAHANTALVFSGSGAATVRAPLVRPARDGWYAWEVSFTPAPGRRATRRRHGDIDSWTP